MATPDWMNDSENWHIIVMEGVVSAPQKGVSFDTSDPSSIKVKLDGSCWGTLDPVTETDTSVTGLTDPTEDSTGQSFQIDYDCNTGTLCCYVEEASSGLLMKLGGGMLAGAVLGGMIGFAGGSPLLGAAAGLSGAAASLLISLGLQEKTQSGGSSPTWVANDSGSGANLVNPPETVAELRAIA